MLVVATFGALPLYFQRRNLKLKNLLVSEKPLSSTEIMRGAYVNTGSKDAGRDHDWDLKTHRWKGSDKDQSWHPVVQSSKAAEEDAAPPARR